MLILELRLDRLTVEEDPEDLPVERLPELRTVPLEVLPLLFEDRTALELRLELPLDRPTLEEDPEDLPVERLPELRTVPLELLPLLLED